MNVNFWNRLAPSFDSVNPSDPQFITFIKKQLPVNSTLLEIGAGTGKLAADLSDSCRLIEASDFSPEMIKRGLEKNLPDSVHLSVEDATNLSFPSEQFDTVLAFNTLHVISNIDKSLSEVTRVLQPNGQFIASIPDFKRNKLSFIFIRWMMKLMKFRLWSTKEYERLFHQHGLEVTFTGKITEESSSVIIIGKKKEIPTVR